MWACYYSFGNPTRRAPGFFGAVPFILAERGIRTAEVVENQMSVQDRRMLPYFRSQMEKEKWPLDKDLKKDLELRKPIELLADRKEETLTAWLLTHPEIAVISRDRGGEYAAAARKGAPQAQQIADKFHLLKNLRDGLKELMARKQKVLPEVEEVSSDGVPRLTQAKQQASALSEDRKSVV